MVYRPTVRYADVFRHYVDDLFHTTCLDRNQILRAALFVSAHSKEFNSLMEKYKKKDVPPSSPLWELDQHGIWMERDPKIREERKDVNANIRGTSEIKRTPGPTEGSTKYQEQLRCESSITRREREISTKRIPLKSEGGTLSWSPFG